MVVKRVGYRPVTAQYPGARGPLSTLVSILGDVASVTGIGIRYF